MATKREFLFFFFSWAKTFRRSFFIFVKYFWWLILLEIAFLVNIFPTNSLKLSAASTAVSAFIMFFSILAIRSTLGAKKIDYFISNIQRSLSYITLTIFFTLSSLLVFWLAHVPFFSAGLLGPTYLFYYGSIVSSVTASLAFPIIPIASFFMLDSKKFSLLPIGSMLKSLKYFFSYFTAFLSIGLLYFFFSRLTPALMSITIAKFNPYLSAITYNLITNVIRFSFLCCIGVLYIKIKHSKCVLALSKAN